MKFVDVGRLWATRLGVLLICVPAFAVAIEYPHWEMVPTQAGIVGLALFGWTQAANRTTTRTALLLLIAATATIVGPFTMERRERELRREAARLEAQRLGPLGEMAALDPIPPTLFPIDDEKQAVFEKREGWGHDAARAAHVTGLTDEGWGGSVSSAHDALLKTRYGRIDTLSQAKAWLEAERRLWSNADELIERADRAYLAYVATPAPVMTGRLSK